MHLKKHLLYIFVMLFVLGVVYFYALTDIFHPKQIASYENFTEMSEELDASREIAEAAKKYPEVKTGAVIVKRKEVAVSNEIALTFDGMDNRGNMDAILKIIADQGWKGTFFVEGVNAARNSTVIQKMRQEGQLIGNYSFVGVSKAERLEPPNLFEQFCRTQKILKFITGEEPKLFKLYDTRYMDQLLRVAKASGLDYAVQSDMSISVNRLKNGLSSEEFVNAIRPGMIVSVQLSRPVPPVFVKKKGPDKPAVDKQPTIQDKPVAQVKEVTTADAIKNLCNRLKEKGFRVVPVTEMIVDSSFNNLPKGK